MTDKELNQLAAEAFDDVSEESFLDANLPTPEERAKGIAIIKAAIAKATEVITAERDHYTMLAQEAGQELRAAQASEGLVGQPRPEYETPILPMTTAAQASDDTRKHDQRAAEFEQYLIDSFGVTWERSGIMAEFQSAIEKARVGGLNDGYAAGFSAAKAIDRFNQKE